MKDRGNPLLKKIDRYIGIPLTYVLGCCRTSRQLPIIKDKSLPLSFLIIKTAAIGDTVLTEPMLREIRNNYPQARFTYICTKTNKAMVELLPGVEKIYVFSLRQPLKSLRAVAKLGEFDFLLDFTPWDKLDSIISYFAKAKYKVGFKHKNMYRHYVYDAYVNHLDSKHEIDNYRALLTSCGLHIQGLKPHLSIEKCDLENIYNPLFESYIVLHICAGGSKAFLKSWNIYNWQELAEQLYKKYQLPFVFTGGLSDLDTIQLISLFCKGKGIPCLVTAGDFSLAQTGTVLKLAKLLITIDTGIMHLGAAVGARVIALQGPTSEQRWGPIGDYCITVHTPMSCSPCISLGFDTDCTRASCMEAITVEQVIEAADKFMIAK